MMKLFKKLFRINQPPRACVLQNDSMRDAEILARDVRMARYSISYRGSRNTSDKAKPPHKH